MTRFMKDAIEAVRSTGLEVLGLEERGVHVAILTSAGRIFISRSPSDFRTLIKVRAHARRLARNTEQHR
jgi:hypothetical protein